LHFWKALARFYGGKFNDDNELVNQDQIVKLFEPKGFINLWSHPLDDDISGQSVLFDSKATVQKLQNTIHPEDPWKSIPM
jgi:hypothetical protein